MVQLFDPKTQDASKHWKSHTCQVEEMVNQRNSDLKSPRSKFPLKNQVRSMGSMGPRVPGQPCLKGKTDCKPPWRLEPEFSRPKHQQHLPTKLLG